MMVRSDRWWREVLICCTLSFLMFAGTAWGAELPGQFSDELTTDHYDCLLSLQPAAQLPAMGTWLALETGTGGEICV